MGIDDAAGKIAGQSQHLVSRWRSRRTNSALHGGEAAVQAEHLNLLTSYPQKQQQCPQPNKKSPAGKTPTGLSKIMQHIPGQRKPVYFTPQ